MGLQKSMEEISQQKKKLPLVSLNHVSYLCRSVADSVKFYEDVLGFILIKRPSSFKFEGAWLFNYGFGIHLLESSSPDDMPPKKRPINPKRNHISFQSPDVGQVVRKLEEMNIEYVTAVVEEGGIKVDQLFFHDPDGYMIEICNCDNLPVLPVSCPLKRQSNTETITKLTAGYRKNGIVSSGSRFRCGNGAEDQMMESLAKDIMDISF